MSVPYENLAKDRDLSALDALYARVAWRIVPLLMACYVASYLNRVNVGFAKLAMLKDLGFTEAVYGFGAGIFFIGYLIFEIPSNIILAKVGARVWLARIMLTWGIISASMALVTSEHGFYILRFLLGVAEAGFFPGVIWYLARWFPVARRARILSYFYLGIPLSGVIGGPVSGMLMTSLDGSLGLAGWQWLFIAEGLPTLVLAIILLMACANGIDTAKWLDASEKKTLTRQLEVDPPVHSKLEWKVLFTDLEFIRYSALFFCLALTVYGINFWLPTLIQSAGIKDTMTIGWLSAIPYAFGAVVMLGVSRSSDRTGDRRRHLMAVSLTGAAGLALSIVFVDHVALALAALSVATAGLLSALPVFWTIPTARYGGLAAGAAIAFINSIGSISGFVGPYFIGVMKTLTNSTSGGVWMMVGVALTATLLAYTLPRRANAVAA